jgi:nucleoside-diphosphate-sugar epimerase
VKTFLTGATGFIGGRLARRLRGAGHDVTALVRAPERAGELSALGVTLARGDITERETVRAAMRGADAIYHVAAWYKIGARDHSMAWRINVEGTRNVLQVMRELGIPRGVYTSTLAVFSDTRGQLVDETHRYYGKRWLSVYDETKAAAHYDVALPMMEAGLPLIIVQPGLNYGPGDTSATRTTFIQYLKGELPLIPRRTAFCWGHVDDTVEAHVLAMERGRTGESYIIAGPAHTLIEALELAGRVTGRPLPRLRAGPQTMRALAAIMGVVERFVPVPETLAAETLRVTAGVTYLGTSAKARRELGFSPRSLADGLPDTLLHEMHLLGMNPHAPAKS